MENKKMPKCPYCGSENDIERITSPRGNIVSLVEYDDNNNTLDLGKGLKVDVYLCVKCNTYHFKPPYENYSF